MERKLSKLFSNMCCSKCGTDFGENSFEILRQEDSMIVFRAICPNCGKSFGVAFLGISNLKVKGRSDEQLTPQMQPCPKPIEADEVLDAHEYIKDFDSNWRDFID